MIALVNAVLPALPLHSAGKYVAGAFIVLFAMVLIYVSIMAIRLSRLERELGELLELSERTEHDVPAAELPEPREPTLAYPMEGHQ
jgi:hypothetical protein